jgi:plasmid stability protein
MSINPNSPIRTNNSFTPNLKARRLIQDLISPASPDQKTLFQNSTNGEVRDILRNPELTDRQKWQQALSIQLDRALILSPQPTDSSVNPDSLISTNPAFANNLKIRQVILGLYDQATPEQKIAFDATTNGEVRGILTDSSLPDEKKSRQALKVQLDRARNVFLASN